MTRTLVGGVAAAALALGLVAGALIPTFFRPAHQPMPGFGAGMGAMWQQHAAHHAWHGGSR